MIYDRLTGITSSGFTLSSTEFLKKLVATVDGIDFIDDNDALININVAEPVTDSNAATKKYVDSVMAGANMPASFIKKQEVFVTTENQTTFTLTQGTYKPNTHTMGWYINGIKQLDTGITETSSTTVSLVTTLPTGTTVILEYLEVTNIEPYPVHADQHLSGGIDPIPTATPTQDGLMSKEDKVSLTNTTEQVKRYTHTQIAPSNLWVIVHNLGRFPSVVITDSAGSVVIGDINYVDNNTVHAQFTAEFAGTAYLN